MTMSAVQCMRELINQRLTAAAEEIFAVFQKTIVEFEEEIDRQRRLLDAVWKPEIRIHRTESLQQHGSKEQEVLPEQQGFQEDVGWKPEINVHRLELPQHFICKQEKEIPVDQQLCNQDQQDPDPPQIKQEQQDPFSSLELVPQQETETFLSTPTCEERERQTLDFSLERAQRAAESTQAVVNIPVRPEPNVKDRLFSHDSSHVSHESRDHRGPQTKPQKRHNKSKNLTVSQDHHSSAPTSLMLHRLLDRPRVQTPEKPLHVCGTCKKRFSSKSTLRAHLAIHRDEKQHSCKTCGKRFRFSNGLTVHMRIHTGEKPYLCNTCGKNFRHVQALKEHIRIHTGERPYTCNTCGTCFRHLSGLKNHVRIHTGEKLCPCKICGKTLKSSSGMAYHMRTHAVDRPFLCNTCGKRYSQLEDLKAHATTHVGEKQFNCAFRLPGNLTVHMRGVHNGEKTSVSG